MTSHVPKLICYARYLMEHLAYIWNNYLAPTQKVIDSVYRPFFTGDSSGQIPIQKESDDTLFCPFFAIRHTANNELVGDLSLYKDILIAPEETSPTDMEQVQESQEAVWEIAFNIFPEWRGKGLGGEVIGVLIEGWALRTNLTAVWAVSETGQLRRITAVKLISKGAETLNPASAGLLRSRGFTKDKTFMVRWPEKKGGGEREVSTFRLELSEYVSRLPPPPAVGN